MRERIYYHMTPVRNLPKIRQSGLQGASEMHGLIRPDVDKSKVKGRVYLSKDTYGLGDMLAGNMAGTGAGHLEGKWALLEVRLPRDVKVRKDPEETLAGSEFHYTNARIDPKNIRVVGYFNQGSPNKTLGKTAPIEIVGSRSEALEELVNGYESMIEDYED